MEKALRSSTGLCDINIRFWDAEHQPPRAVLTIMHGMAEHVDRYDDFAGFLAQNGIAVAAADMASHGKSISENGHAARRMNAQGMNPCCGPKGSREQRDKLAL